MNSFEFRHPTQLGLFMIQIRCNDIQIPLSKKWELIGHDKQPSLLQVSQLSKHF